MSGDPNPRTSITQRPSTVALIDEMHKASGLSQTELYSAGIDFLHFAWSVSQSGGVIAYKQAESDEYVTLHIVVPGLIRPTL